MSDAGSSSSSAADDEALQKSHDSSMSTHRRDRLAYDVYQSVLRSERGDWIELINCAPLASQYHLSEYSISKYGHHGAPYAYLPLSLQQPELTESILLKQNGHEASAWLCELRTERLPACHEDIPVSKKHPVKLSCDDSSVKPVPVATEEATTALEHGHPSTEPSFIVKTSISHPIKYVWALLTVSVSAIVPPELIPMISHHVFSHIPSHYKQMVEQLSTTDAAIISWHKAIGRAALPEHISISLKNTKDHLQQQVRGDQLIRVPMSLSLEKILQDQGIQTWPMNEMNQPTIGNMYLSSCPGKKVRLDGHVQGRSAICRDLKVDLQRYKDLGIHVIVCCLDDDELQLLGSPFEEYKKQVESQGFDLVRLPIAEGFAPLDLSRLDAILSVLILNYTLRGASILVHCRGGVGRAGLIACAWILKMNFVAPEDNEAGKEGPLPSAKASDDLRVVISLIKLIRMRRSLRAIETAEQACFLLEYVRLIHQQEYARTCYSTCTA